MKRLFLFLCLSPLICSVYIDEDDGFGMDEALNAQPRLVSGEWSACSASCGNGVESRTIECRVSHPLAGHLKLPLHECRNIPSPALFRPCSIQPCALKEEESGVQREEYHWKHSEWTPCSASCLGGKQRALLQCIQLSSGRPVAWSNCDGRRRPPERTRSCNSRPCPPEWVVGEWSPCPSECGSSQSRSLSCISTVTHAGGAVARVTMNETSCKGDKPATTQLCQQECGGWRVGAWSACSVTCGAGIEQRKVQCDSNPTRCRGPKPIDRRECSLQSCPQDDEQEKEDGNGKKLTLDLGGVATLYQGTSIKVKCPRKKEDVRKMYWLKDGERLHNNGHIKMSSNGNLRIAHARMEDAGLYECLTPSGLRGNVTIRFKLREDESEAKDKLKGGKKLKKGKAKYKGGPWGECHQSNCQLRGIQERKLECYVTEGKSHREVSVSICETLNITRPPTSRPCTRLDCAKWNATSWSSCNSSPCVRKYTSEQTRRVECLASDGRKVPDSECESSAKPALSTLCANPACTAEWKTSEWSGCTSSCGTGGVQLRILHCIWNNSGRPAGNACDGEPQPRITRACSRTSPLPACIPHPKEEENSTDCEDHSRFCDIIKLFHSCESEHVTQRCCNTCRKIEKNRV